MFNFTSGSIKPLTGGILLSIVFLLLVSLFISCSSASTAPEINITTSDKERNRHPNTTNDEIDELISGNAEFAFALYQALKDEGDNLFYSPFSISQALAMTYAGARGETEKQIADTLRFTLHQERLHPAFNWLDLELGSRGEGAKGSDEGEFRLNIANSIWAQMGYNFMQDFLDTLAENYSAGVRLVDFISDPESCRITINRWVEDKTEDRIKDLLPQGVIDTLTRLVLVNAIYFNAAWEFPFPEETTGPGTFYTLDGPVQVQMMHAAQGEDMIYVDGDGFEAVDIPYDAEELSMTILLPDKGNLGQFEDALNAARVESIIDSMGQRNVFLTMPKFEFTSQFGLKSTLSEMGMPIAFQERAADLSGMDGTRDLFISDVVHKAFINVNEAGTEAAAATAVIIGITSMPADPVYFTVDRPFIFLIQDIPTGAILFVGRVLEP